MFERLTQGWNLMRIIRSVFGGVVLLLAAQNEDLILGLFGGIILLQALLNAGCCCNGSACKTTPHPLVKKGEEITYKEIT